MNEFRNVDANEWVCTRCQNVVPVVSKTSPPGKLFCGICGSGSLIQAGTPQGIKILTPHGTEVLGKLKNPPRNPVGVLGIIGFIVVALCGFIYLVSVVGIPKIHTPEPVKEQRELTPQEKQALIREKIEAVKKQRLLESQAKTFKFYQAKAQEGDAFAQYQLGLIYLNGLGVSNDLSTARAWLEKSAAQGRVEAQKELAKLPPN